MSLYSGDVVLRLDLCFIVRSISLYFFEEFDTVNILKVKSSLLRGFERCRTSRQWVRTLDRFRTVQGLNALGQMLHSGALFEELIHSSGGRHVRIAQADETVLSGSESLVVDERVTLNRKRFGAVQVVSTVLLSLVLIKNSLVVEKAQLGRTLFFLQVLLMTYVYMSSL